MSCSDQYIGLTADACKFVEGLEYVGTHNIVGAFYNQIHLGTWASKEKQPNGKYAIYIEVVQMEPWSSGPMYFTHLLHDFQNGAEEFLFSWVVNPMLGDQEYDIIKGQMYV